MKKIYLALVICAFTGCDSPSNDGGSGNSSFEQNYVKNRFKAEGYSNSDSEKAAKAVMKFHEAQKRRK